MARTEFSPASTKTIIGNMFGDMCGELAPTDILFVRLLQEERLKSSRCLLNQSIYNLMKVGTGDLEGKINWAGGLRRNPLNCCKVKSPQRRDLQHQTFDFSLDKSNKVFKKKRSLIQPPLCNRSSEAPEIQSFVFNTNSIKQKWISNINNLFMMM